MTCRFVSFCQRQRQAWLRIDCRNGASQHVANTLGERLLAEMDWAYSAALADADVQQLWLMGREDSFLTGADLPFFARCLLANDRARLLGFTREARQLWAQLATSPKPVAAWIEGPAWGAGLELALACQHIVAAPNATFALPETGLGIYPGLGGTQRTPRRIGVGLAKWMIYTGAIVPAAQALEIGLIDAISAAPPPFDSFVARNTAKPTSRAARWKQLETFFTEHSLDALLSQALQMPSDPVLVRAMIQVRRRAPLALRIAERLIEQSQVLSLDAGLQEEYDHLDAIFASEDARTGILTLGRSRPEFVGR